MMHIIVKAYYHSCDDIMWKHIITLVTLHSELCLINLSLQHNTCCFSRHSFTPVGGKSLTREQFQPMWQQIWHIFVRKIENGRRLWFSVMCWASQNKNVNLMVSCFKSDQSRPAMCRLTLMALSVVISVSENWYYQSDQVRDCEVCR